MWPVKQHVAAAEAAAAASSRAKLDAVSGGRN
jgi:hypothetical protein